MLDWERIQKADPLDIANDEDTAEQFFEILADGDLNEEDAEVGNQQLMVKLFHVAKAVLSVKGLQYEAAIDEMEKITQEAAGAKEKEMLAEIDHLQAELEQYKKYSGTGDKYFRTEILQLEERNKMVEKELQELERRLLKEQNSYDRVNSEMQNMENRYQDTKRELDRALSDIKEYQRQFQSQRESMIVRRSNVEDVKDQISKKNRELSQYLDEVKQLQEANDKLQSEVGNAEKELEQATQDMNNMADDYTKLKKVLEDTDSVVEDMRKERDILRSQIQDMESQLQTKASGDDEIMLALNKKVAEWKDIMSLKDEEINRRNQEIIELEKQLQASRMDSDRNAMIDLMEANTKKDEHIKELKKKLELATKDYEDVTDHINTLKSKSKDGAPSLYQQKKIQSLNMTLEREQSNTVRERERVMEIEQDVIDKDKEIAELTNRLIQYEQGQYGLAEAVLEIKDCRAQMRVRDKNIEDLTKNINDLHVEIEHLDLENEEMRERLGIGSREELDTNAIRKKRAVKEEQAQALNLVLQKEVEKLEEERVQLKRTLRKHAMEKGERAVELGLSVMDLEPIDDEIVITSSKSKIVRPSTVRIDQESMHESIKETKNIENLVIQSKLLEDENKVLKNENNQLEIGLREIHGALKSGIDSTTPVKVPALDKLIAMIEERNATGQYDTTVQLKAQIQHLSGRNEELRSELRNAQYEINKTITELDKRAQKIGVLEKETESLKELSEGVIKLNPLPLPEGVAPTSKDIIACLNEYLIQILQELSNKKELCIQMENALEESRRNFSVAIHQQGLLYKEHLELKSESDKEKNKLTEEKEEALLSKDQNDIRLQEFEKLLENLKTDPNKFKQLLAELTRKLTVLRVNEKSLTRRYTILQEVEKNLRKANSRLHNDALDIHEAVTKKIGDLERHKEISSYKITALQKALEDTVPISELELTNRKFNELTSKYRDLLQQENVLVARSSAVETLQAELKAYQHTDKTIKEKLQLEKERSYALEQTLTELLHKLGKEADGAAQYQTEEIASVARKLATLEMKELNERQRADHATQKYDQLRSLLTELENRNAELEQKFAEIAKLNLDCQRIERELRDELSNCVPAEIARADKALIQKLEESEGVLKVENSRLKEVADIAQHQTETVTLRQKSQEKELMSLRKQLYELQMETDEKTIIAKLHQQIVALQVSESTAVRKLKIAKTKLSKQEAYTMKQQHAIDEKNEGMYHLRSETRAKTRFLKKVIQDLRRQFSGALPLGQQERFSETLRSLQERKIELETALNEARAKYQAAEDYSMELKLRYDGLQELIVTLKDGQGAKKVAEWHARMGDIKLEDMKLKRDVEKLKEKILYLERVNKKHENLICILEEDNIKQAKEYEDRQLLFEQHEVELERSIAKLERQQQDMMEAARKFEEATGSIPDESLPVANQLDLAVGKIKEHIKTIIITRAEANKMKEDTDSMKAKLRAAETSLMHKDKIINDLRLRLPISQRDVQLLSDIPYDTKPQQSAEERQALRVAQTTVESLKLMLQKKDENLTKYQDMLNKSREELRSQADTHRQEMKVLQERLQLEIEEHIKKIKRVHHDFVNAPQAVVPTSKQLKRLAELEEMVDEQDNALGTASHKYRKGLEDLKNLKLEAEENIKILKQQMNEMRNKYENERKQLEEVIEGKNNIVKEKGLEIEVLQEELKSAKEANEKAPSKTMKSLVERLRNQLAKKEKEQKALSQALFQIRSDMVSTAEENVQSYAKKIEDEISVQKLIEKETMELNNRIQELQERMEKMKKELKRKKDSESNMTFDVESLKKDVQKRDAALKEMALELKEREDLEEKYEKLKAENKKLKSAMEKRAVVSEDVIKPSQEHVVESQPIGSSDERPAKDSKNKEEVVRWEESKKWQKKVETLKIKLKEKTEECAHLDKTNLMLREGLSRQERDKLTLQNRLKSVSKSHGVDYRGTSLHHDDVIAGLKQKIFELEDENNDLTKRLNLDREKEIQELRIRNSQLNESVHALESELARQQKEHDPDGYNWSVHREQELQKEMLEVRKENMELRFENEQAHKDVPRLKARVADLQEYVEILKNEIESLKKKDKTKKAAMGTGMGGQSVEDMERVIAAMRRVVERLQVENETLKKQSGKPRPHGELTKENRYLKQEVQRLKQLQTADNRRVQVSAPKSTAKLIQENDKLRKDLKKVNEENEKLRMTNCNLQLINEKLNNDIKEKDDALSEVNNKIEASFTSTDGKSKSLVVNKLYEQKIKSFEKEIQKKNSILKDIKTHLRGAAEREAELLRKIDDLEGKVIFLQDFPPGIHTESDVAKHLQQKRLQVNRLEAEKKELTFELDRLRQLTNNGEVSVDVTQDEVLNKLRNYDKMLSVEVDLRTRIKGMEIEREKHSAENKKLKKELLAFDPAFFEELEDLKYNYKKSMERNVLYEKQLKQLSNQFGVQVHIPINDDQGDT